MVVEQAGHGYESRCADYQPDAGFISRSLDGDCGEVEEGGHGFKSGHTNN
jgi:hypothetical protein